MIVDSTFTEGVAQADGRVYVTEKHTAEDGQVYTYEYLAAELNSQFVMEERAKAINAILAQREAARLAVVGTTVPLTRYEFLGRFTAGERVAIRELARTDAIVEDFMEMMKLSGNVSLVLARPGLNYLVIKGALTQARADEIGAD